MGAESNNARTNERASEKKKEREKKEEARSDIDSLAPDINIYL